MSPEEKAPKKTPSLLRFEAYCAKREEIKQLKEFIRVLDGKRAEAMEMLVKLEAPKNEMVSEARLAHAAKSQRRNEIMATADTVKAPLIRKDTPGTMESVKSPSVSKVLPKQTPVLIWDIKEKS